MEIKTKINSLEEPNSLDSDLNKYFSSHFENNNSKKKIAIAVSGGIDSISLLYAISKLYPKELINCLHIDHGWHDNSHQAVNFLQEYCKDFGIEFHHRSYALGEMKQDENSAREKRYEFFISKCKELIIKDIFLAHNLNDQAETILFRVFRGTSTSGLKGIEVQKLIDQGNLNIHRPLINTKREDIETYFRNNKLQHIEDPSNSNVNYHRNKIRHQIIPLIDEINPSLLGNLKNLSQIVGEEQEYLKKQCQEAIKTLGDMPWDLQQFRLLDKAIQRKILENTFTSNIRFCNQFLDAINQGGYHKINYSKDTFFVIKQKQIHKQQKP